VAGPANALPREWARAWQVCRAGDAERMRQVRSVLESFRAATQAAGAKQGIACLKRALLALGVVRSAAVARGTPELSADAAARFDDAFAALRAMSQETIGEPWVSLAPDDLEAPRPGNLL
jgi:dihydrodipicolinate synthase/N-acetylneuraminate lyase